MKKKRILIPVHQDLIPPESVPGNFNWSSVDWITEFDVYSFLREKGHDVLPVGIVSDLSKLRKTIDEFQPHIAFNLLEEFAGEAIFDQNVVSYFELLNVPYTGCNPRGLILCRDKAITKKLLSYHRVTVPKFLVLPRNRRKKVPKNLPYPMIVKCLNEEASLGISRASIVHSDEKLIERAHFIHESYHVDAIAEQFIEGRELYCGILGNFRMQTLPPWELFFKKVENSDRELYSSRAKFNKKYRREKGIDTGPADVSERDRERIQAVSRKVAQILGINGYARIDFRLTPDGRLFVLEANPNPDIGEAEDFAMSADHVGIEYPDLLEKIVKLGIRWGSSAGA